MRRFFPVLVVLCSVRVHARAEPAAAPASALVAETRSAPLALAVNLPLSWGDRSFGVSGYVRLDEHVAVRGNVASYKSRGPIGAALGELSGDGGTGYGGSILDVGIALVWYPRRVWDGPLLEVGALWRDRDVYVWPEFENQTFTRSKEYAVRGLVGWSWLIRQRAFIAIAAGLSAGVESGTETSMPDRMPMTTQRVSRTQTEGEGYLRFGVVFGD